jgi:hypothetical protein
MFIRSAKAGVEAAETFALCFADERASHGLIAFLTGGAARSFGRLGHRKVTGAVENDRRRISA